MSDPRYAHIQLALTPYVGAEAFAALVAHFGSAAAALAAPAEQIRTLFRHGAQAAAGWADTSKARAAADAALEWAQQSGCRLLLSGETDYPAMLGEGLTPPPLLFVRGNAALLHRPSVAVVGSRHATPQAVRIARDFGRDLSGRGITVVSGMAAGIDTAAHLGALEGSGSTVAVWGTGVNRVYPPANKELAHRIAEQGVVVSEFPLDTRPLAGNFPRRNRIIAALGLSVLVVEAALESGSLITARLAAELGREVMAVPGSIDNPHSKGCHKLIKEGAKLVECSDDILNECPLLLNGAPLFSGSLKSGKNLAPSTEKQPEARQQPAQPLQKQPEKQPEKPSAADVHPLLQHMGYDPVHPDTLAETLHLPAADIYAQLLEWELDGTVAAAAGGRYQRIR